MLILKNIIKDYPLGQNEVVHALKGINLSFGNEGFVSILGPSGCGKTTLLNIIGGLDQYTDGDLIIDGVSTKDFEDKDWDLYRNVKIGFVFQNYNLVPQLTILENVEIPLSLNGENGSSRREKALKALEKVGLADIAKKKPNQLSGGQMQRVAIARSLVNDPEIILADEPTGALDSETSVIVLDILKEISKTKLVIMVTHNQELADRYSTRIIKMSDGNIIDDSQKEDVDIPNQYHEISGKTSMKYSTSFKMSLRNIATKKGRVALIAVASSFGVIGVGLVLAVTNGFDNYIARVEAATASNAPVTIQSTSISYSLKEGPVEFEKFPDEEIVNIYEAADQGVVKATIHKNEFTNEFLEYLDNIENTEKYKGVVASKLINYSLPQYALVGKSKTENTYTYIDNNTSVSSLLSSLSSYVSLPNTIFHELYGDQKYIEKSYDVIKGSYPKNEVYIENGKKTFDICLVVDQYNRIDKSTLVKLGLIPENSKQKTFNFDEILNTTFKFYANDEIYFFNEENPDDIYDTAVYKDFPVSNINIYDPSGAVDEQGNRVVLGSIPFPAHRGVQYFNYSNDQKALSQLYNDEFVIKKNGVDTKSESINLKVSGILRVNKQALLDYMPMSLCYTNGFKEYIKKLNENSNISRNILENIMPLQDQINNFIQNMSSETQVDTRDQDFVSQFNACFATFLPTTDRLYYDSNTKSFTGEYSQSYYVKGYGNSLKKVLGYGGDISLSERTKEFLDKLSKEQDEKTLTEFATYIILNQGEVIRILNYLSAYLNSATLIDSIVLFPTNLSNKTLLKEYIDKYNEGKKDEQTIVYSDIVGTLTESLEQMINIVSIVLIVFAAISLVVSCVMTGIITYNSVLERIKEIGILRAIGARKKDVGRLFKSESTIIGLFSGLIGVVAVYILSIPINAIINAVYPDYNIGNIAALSVIAALVLIIVSGALSFVSGIIPARKAAKKDPVVALRSE